MSRKTRFKLLTAAVNSGVYGADAIDAGVALAILTSDLDIIPIEGDTQDRPIDDGQLGAKPVAMIGTHVKVTGYIEIAGAGDPVTLPGYHPILSAAGYEGAPNVDEVAFARATPGSEKDVTFYVYKDGVVHKVTGARATFTTNITVNEIPRREFEITGLYAGHQANNNLPAADFSQFQKPTKVGFENTTITIGAFEMAMLEFELNDNNEITYDENTLNEEVYLTDYQTEGRMLVEAPEVGAFDPIDIALSEALQTINLTHGTTAGRIEVFSLPQVQLMRPTYQNRNGRITWEIPFRVIGSYTFITQ